MKTETETEIERAAAALIAAIDAERARLPSSGKDAEKAENRLLRRFKKAIDAIERARYRIYDNRQQRKWKEDEPARQERAQEYELRRQVMNAVQPIGSLSSVALTRGKATGVVTTRADGPLQRTP